MNILKGETEPHSHSIDPGQMRLLLGPQPYSSPSQQLQGLSPALAWVVFALYPRFEVWVFANGYDNHQIARPGTSVGVSMKSLIEPPYSVVRFHPLEPSKLTG